MTLKEAYEKRRQEVLALQRDNTRLKSTIEKLKVGTYVDAEKADHIRTINRLTQKNSISLMSSTGTGICIASR